MKLRKKLLMTIIHGIKCVIDNSESTNYNEDIYIDLECITIDNKIKSNITKTSITDIAYNYIDVLLARLYYSEEIYISRILDLNIDNKPVIVITTNPCRFCIGRVDNTLMCLEYGMKIKMLNGKVRLSYANDTTKSNK